LIILIGFIFLFGALTAAEGRVEDGIPIPARRPSDAALGGRVTVIHLHFE
jgi:hypothetical protein